MRINVKGLAFALAIVWGATVLLTGTVNLLYPDYGRQLLLLLASLYPGYHAASTIPSVLTGALYAAVDGLILGLLVGWLYNRFASKRDTE